MSIVEDGVTDPYEDDSYSEKNRERQIKDEEEIITRKARGEDEDDGFKQFLIIGLVALAVIFACVVLACVCQKKRVSMRETF